MRRLRTDMRMVLILGVAIAPGLLATKAQALGWLDCGPKWDYCTDACDANVPGGPPLAICHNQCNIGVSICEASRIPPPGSYRHPRRVSLRR
jgi:hypothetical protein